MGKSQGRRHPPLRADDIVADQKVRKQFAELQEKGYGHFPVCMAKTQYSLSADPSVKGAPTGYTVPIREIRLSAGAEFLVAVCGEIMTMPGFPGRLLRITFISTTQARSRDCSEALSEPVVAFAGD